MRSLFVKFFLSFLLIIVLIAAIGITMTYLRDQEFPPLAHQYFARQAIKEYGRGAIHAYEEEGRHELEEYAEKLFEVAGVRIILFSAAGHPLTEQQVPRRMLHMARRALQSGEVVFPMRGARNWVASPLKSASGQTYAVAIGLPEKPPPKHLVRGLSRGFLGWRLLVLLGVAALVCYWLARSFASPISRLRQATRQIAAGDLAIRVGDQVKGKTEIGGLARDFDHMAERIEDLVGSQHRLLRDISHELRSPLARLGVALELARQETDQSARQSALERIELEAERMNEMIGQLLSLTRLESGTSELQCRQFDLTELLSNLVLDADFEASKRGCQVRLTSHGPVLVNGSQELLGRALENVIRNAVKYTADDSLVSVELSSAPQGIDIRILDQGPGVPEDALEKLFEPFYRVADARDRQSGGTGIGLTIAERAVRLHNGTIKAKNRPAGGLAVEIHLPCRMN
jgi:two-component system sensor histidine kinase CpxA